MPTIIHRHKKMTPIMEAAKKGTFTPNVIKLTLQRTQ